MTLDQTFPSGLLIGDRWVTSTTAGTMSHVNPTTGRVQHEFPVAGAGEVDAAVATARGALNGWRAIAPRDRRALLQRLAGLIADNAGLLATTTTLENGTPSRAAAGIPLMVAEWFDYYAGWTDKLHGDVIPVANAFDYTVYEPFGVVAIILTWNGPFGLIGFKVAAALAAGCTVVLKPPELAPYSSGIFGRLCLEAGLPPGVVNVVVGGPEAGQALVRHPGIDKISFTGGPETGRSIQAACAEALTPLLLELGGKSAHVVLDDADLGAAAAASAAGITRLNGQVCVAPSRLLVQRNVYDDVVGQVVSNLEAMRIGDPTDPATDMGPVISARAQDRILGLVAQARDKQEGELVSGGRAVGEAGFFVQPTVFSHVDSASPIACTEVFGPVLSVMPFDDEADAIRMANDTPYGLAAYVHTSSLERAHRMASTLDAGTISINGGVVVSPYGPFGGFKDSGYGKEGGREGILEYVRTKRVSYSF